MPLTVQVIAWTHFEPPATPWDIDPDTDATGGEALAEFAGRACYESWHKPNPATATNAGYLRHILEVGHLSVLEHANVTMYLRGVSRSLTHELIRHRHFSYSQLSQRYAPSGEADMVEPEVVAADPELHARFVEATAASLAAYRELLAGLEAALRRRGRLGDAASQAGPAGGAVSAAQRDRDADRRHRQLPRVAALRRDARVRARRRRDPGAGGRCLRELQRVAPNAFADFEITALPDGTSVASSPYVTEG